MSAAPPRYAILYAVERWRASRWFIGWLLLVLLTFTVFLRPKGQSVTVLLLPGIEAVVIGVVYVVALYIALRTSYLEVRADGLRLQYWHPALVSIDIPYAAVSRIRKQPLDVAFAAPERRRYRNRFTRRLGRQPAIYLRLDRRQEALIADLDHRLGGRFVLGNDLVLPITDPNGFLNAVKPRIRTG